MARCTHQTRRGKGKAMTFLSIEADTGISFDIEHQGKSYLLHLSGGRWQLMHGGAVIDDLGHARVKSLSALKRALDYIWESKS